MPFELGFVEFAGAHPTEDLRDPHHGEQVRQSDEDEEGARDDGADQAQRLQQRRTLVLHRAHDRTNSDRQQERQAEHDAGVAQGKPETCGQRPRALADQLAGGVVDYGDVVGVERMPHPEQVGRHPESDAEDARRSQRDVLRRHPEDQHAPAKYVERQDNTAHRGDRRPIRSVESAGNGGFGCATTLTDSAYDALISV